MIVYVIVALILLFPLIRRLLPAKPLVPVVSEAAHEIEEAHHQHGLTDSVSVERHAGDDRGRRPGGYRDPGATDWEGGGDAG